MNYWLLFRISVMSRDVNGYPGSRDPNLLPEPGLSWARYRTACRLVAESPAHCMNAPQHTRPTKLCCEAWTAWGREIAN